MTCDVRILNYASLAFGLMSFGALSLAVATDFWLFTDEPLSPDMWMDMVGPGGFNESYPYDEEMPVVLPGVIVANLHSGLWRACMFYASEPGGYFKSVIDVLVDRIMQDCALNSVG